MLQRIDPLGRARPRQGRPGRLRWLAGLAALAMVSLALLACLPAGRAEAGQRATVVTFTFDDGTADQMSAARVLHSHGMAGTFFIITGAVGAPHYMTRGDLRALASAGDEIGGHTVSHLDLVNASAAEVRRQICAGRNILTRWGFDVSSFAYPDGAYNRAVERIVRGCGYGAARIAAGLRSPGCPNCTVAESARPTDPYAIRTPGQVDTSWTLQALKQVVITAERGGGWVPLIFHHVCQGGDCGQLSVSGGTFSAFVGWLAQQKSHGTVVRTMSQVLGAPVRPPVHVRPAQAHGVVNPSLEMAGPSAQTNPSMETPDRSGAPSCWMEGGYGSNKVSWRRVHGSRAGRWAEQLTVLDYHNGGAELIQLFDLGACSLPVHQGRSYQLSAWYKGTARTQFAVYYADGAGRWRYWTSSPYFSPAASWANVSWQTPPVPAGASGLSFGLSLFSNGRLTTDGYGFAPAPPNRVPMILGGTLILLVMAGAAAWGIRRAAQRRPAHRTEPLAPPSSRR